MNTLIVSSSSPVPPEDSALTTIIVINPNEALDQKPWINGDYGSLPEIPLLYPIERTNTIVECSDPHVIADRIVRSLQKLSIIATFNSSDASLRAETIDHTEFYVRMYKHNNGNNGEIMVEVQRSKGESFNYIKYARVILASARGDDNVDFESEIRKRSSSASLSYVPGSTSCLHEPVECCKTDISSVDHVKELIQKDRVDARQLGMTSLLLLTDSERSLVSESAAQAVLEGDKSGQSVIKDFIYNHISSTPISSPREVDRFASREQGIMHNTALAVLGNSLETALESQHSNLTHLLQTKEWMGNSGIVDILLSELSNAQDRLHDAYQAARCITALLVSSCDIKRELLDRNVADVLKDARLIGVSKHSLLAAECEEALALISGDDENAPPSLDDENVPPSLEKASDCASSFWHWPWH